jgi:hypothetical protein
MHDRRNHAWPERQGKANVRATYVFVAWQRKALINAALGAQHLAAVLDLTKAAGSTLTKQSQASGVKWP